MCKKCEMINALCAYADEQMAITKPRVEQLQKETKILLEKCRQERQDFERKYPNFCGNKKR